MNISRSINRFVIANPEVCIGCATCMAACYQSAYDRGKLAVPRLIVTRTSGGVMPNQCRQCDDSPCANVCPVGALRFGDGMIESYEEICIGCKMCTLACPFGAIRAEAEIMPSVDYAIIPDYNLGLESEIGNKSVAVKCDLCVGGDKGPMCVQVCPTNALVLMDGSIMDGDIVSEKAQDSVETFIQTQIN